MRYMCGGFKNSSTSLVAINFKAKILLSLYPQMKLISISFIDFNQGVNDLKFTS